MALFFFCKIQRAARGSESARRGAGSAAPAGSTTAGASASFVAELDGREGSPLARLDVANTTGRDVYLHVVSVSEDRSIRPILPSQEHDDVLLPAGETRRVYVFLALEKDWPAGRAMRDRYLVVATAAKASFWPTAQRPAQLAPPGGSDLPQEIKVAIDSRTTRGESERAGDPGDSYGVIAVDLVVRRVDGSR